MDFKKSQRKPSEVGRCCFLFSSVFFFVFRCPDRNDQPPMQHLAPISLIIARSRESRVISSICSPIHFAMLPLRGVILDVGIPPRRFPSTFLCITHLIYIARRLWLCGQRMRACGAPPIAVWWCSALSKYFGMYGALSPTDL